MKNRIHFLPLSAMMLAIALATLPAQVPDGGSSTYINATNVFANITVGTNGSFTLLTLGNNALFTNSGNGVIGLNATARSNEVRLISPTARWLMNGTLHVGSNGAANRLVVSNGATVRNSGVGYLGVGVSSSNNIALVTGAGSLWTNGNSVVLGDNGMGNQLVISNGGVVRAASAFVSIGLSSNNLMTVSGPGSAWNSSGDFRFGYSGAGNQLLITDGGLVQDATGTLGSNPTGRNNSALVTGAGSAWSNQLNLVVGLDGAGNQLVVSNAGKVVNQTGYIGGGATSSSNSVVVVGTNSLWSLSQSLAIGSSSQNNQLVVSNGGVVSAVGAGNIGVAANGIGNSATVTGPGARWTMGNNLTVGNGGAGSRLAISNGGCVENLLGTIGEAVTSTNNVAVVTGVGSVWSNAYTLYLGNNGRGNQLWITNGGVVRDTLTYVGNNSTSSSNLAVVAGAGSVWSNAFEVYFGYAGAGNQLVVSNAGVLQSSIVTIGNGISSSNNLAVVTGSGSMWSNTYEFYLGFSGAGNQLLVGDGGWVRNSRGIVGLSASGSNNAVLVTGAGSIWTNAQDLFIGYAGPRNHLVISNGATVYAASSFIGYDPSALGNTVTISDPGTRWLLSSNIYVGTNGGTSRLVITNGAYVENTYCTVGSTISSSNNEVVVTGVGTFWTNRQVLNLGESGSGNRLVVSGGARLRSNLGSVGVNFSSSNNQAILTGPGTFWRVPNSLIFGSQSSGNRLVLSNGAAMSTDGAYVGFSNICSNNVAIITGTGSAWTNTGPMYVGNFSPANLLLISNGGWLVSSRIITVGDNAFAPANLVVIDGGTLLMTSERLDVKRGTNVLNAGLIDLIQLLVTNALGLFEFNGGTLVTSGTTNNNGRVFTVGNGSSAANCRLRGGTHSFANNLSIANNGSLTGTGTVLGTVNVLAGGTLAPGTSIGKLTLNNSPVLQGATLMEISRNGVVLTNDEIQVNALLVYTGTLTVTNIGPTPLAAGDRFRLFTSGTYLGSFSSVSLPPLGFNLSWTNKLAVDGSIEVVSGPVPRFTSISKSGTNLVLTGTGGVANTSYVVLTATNAAQMLNQWTSIATNQFGAGGSFSFTNGINPGTPQRFFRLRWP